ncbi:MAG: transposase [Dactylosporangium sp.]|nr:transposase [Dactylosporangium sp.]
MKLTLMVKLQPTPDQAAALLETMERFNAACNAVAEVAFQERTANKIRLQRLVYYDIRERFGLPAQMAVRVISKVAEAYKRDKSKKPSFRAHGAIVYDQRVLSWKGLDRVSILTLKGRQLVPVVFGGYQTARLKRIRGQADLIYRDGSFYLAVVVDVPEPPADEAGDWLGVDLGIANIAADSDGGTYSGGHVNGLRKRHAKLRARLQAKGTKSAKRLLKKRRRKEQRFARNINHVISKRLVAKAKDTGRGIALEDLKGIRERITVRKAQRRVQHSWAFHQLRSFIEYKARLAGVPVILVDPKNTSRTCPECGTIDKANRPTRDHFCCVSCGFAGPADTIAAVNIRRRAVVMQPYAAGRMA